jgi:hypothetical protein
MEPIIKIWGFEFFLSKRGIMCIYMFLRYINLMLCKKHVTHGNVNHNAISWWVYCITYDLVWEIQIMICKKLGYCISHLSLVDVVYWNNKARSQWKQDDNGELNWNKYLMKLVRMLRVATWPQHHHLNHGHKEKQHGGAHFRL